MDKISQPWLGGYLTATNGAWRSIGARNPSASGKQSGLQCQLARCHCFWSPMLFKQLESVVLFVPDIDIAASWYADLFQTEVQRENAQYAFIQAPGCLLGFHPLDSKCPGGPGGTTIYWEVANLPATIRELELKGAVLYRGPITTSFGAKAAILLDPFGCTLGLNQSTPQSLNALARTV